MGYKIDPGKHQSLFLKSVLGLYLFFILFLGSTFGNTGTSTGGGLFGASTTSASTGLFGTPTQQPAPTTAMPSFGLPGAANNNNTLVGFGQPDNKAPFLLQKPPMGNKKGKK